MSVSLSLRFKETSQQQIALNCLNSPTIDQVLIGGGAGGGKSRLGCQWLIERAIRYPGTRWLMGRSQLKTLKTTTLLTFFDICSEQGIREGIHYKYNEQMSRITWWNGSEFYLMDLEYYPSDPNYDRIGSTEYTGAFVDEANQITAKCKDVIMSRIRYKLVEYHLTPKLLMSCNPAKNWTYSEFYKPEKEGKLPANQKFVQMLVADNPFISPYYIQSLQRMKDKALRERLLFGNWEYDDDPLAMFSPDGIADMFNNPKAKTGNKYLTCDVARFGRDKMVIMVWEGLRAKHIKTMAKSSTVEVENQIRALAQAHGIMWSHVVVDEDGVGGGVVDHLKCKGFVGGQSPFQNRMKTIAGNKENYQNLRAQCYFTLSEYVREGKVSIDFEDAEIQEMLTEELEQIKAKNVDIDGKLKVIAKDDIKEHLGRSPDFADTVMMRMYFEVVIVSEPRITWL